MEVLIINALRWDFEKKLHRFMLSYYFLLCEVCYILVIIET
jgi:hypothetical protein